MAMIARRHSSESFRGRGGTLPHSPEPGLVCFLHAIIDVDIYADMGVREPVRVCVRVCEKSPKAASSSRHSEIDGYDGSVVGMGFEMAFCVIDS